MDQYSDTFSTLVSLSIALFKPFVPGSTNPFFDVEDGLGCSAQPG
jgi:hypothetical protein